MAESAETEWELTMRKMTNAEIDAENDYNAAWRVRARANDAERMSLDALKRDLDARAAALVVAEAAKAAAEAPASPAELELLDGRRVTQHVAAALKRENLDDIVGISDAAFGAALAKVPAGWVDGRTDADHLAELRVTPTVVETPEPEPTDGGGLAALK
jgi:2-keto-4-pentenoate hydratase/2-oxohepta-3-ene-1,7-dioic acid hydratase in catechol pathway